MRRPKKHPELAKSPLVVTAREASADESKAAAFLESLRWGDDPACPHCASMAVYQMKDAATGGRNRKFLWLCRDCLKKFTVRTGTVMEASHLGFRHWVYAFWQLSTGKSGVSARQIQRHCQITYRAALFLLHRVRMAMAQDRTLARKLDGIVEADETYVGGKPRIKGISKRGRGTRKTPVFACVSRQGEVRTKVVADVTADTLKQAIHDVTRTTATIMTDDLSSYKGIGKAFDGGHHTVNHTAKEYAKAEPLAAPHPMEGAVIHTNTVENFFRVLKRGLGGVYNAVSKKHLPRYLAEFEWRYNMREKPDGDRLVAIVHDAIGKRLRYREAA